ncbi:MAG TPA: metallophosphoesterase [Treponemataceae bacterium]|nr:metallophosphoesterase [Treponemataceae bacterium]HPS44900.1 metallophosphoesterase [Treponemataceae bacterium]
MAYQARDRIVVVSDVHIGKRNADGSPAGWFYGKYEKRLEAILTRVAENPRVRELVFLGDLFDTWLYSVEERPETVREIVDAWMDAPFVPRLLECVARLDAVWYIPGNHDMHVRQADLSRLTSGGKSITLTTIERYSARASELIGCEVHLEHGNDADFFNAPDRDSDTVQGLPFGYFVTRLIAKAPEFDYDAAFRSSYRMAMLAEARALASGHCDAGEKPGAESGMERRLGHRFIELFVDALVDFANGKRDKNARIGDDTPVRMPAGYASTTVGEIKSRYSSLLGEWLESHKTYMFAAAGKSGLDRYARKKFGKVNWFLWLKRLMGPARTEMIVVMGHTHFGKLERVRNRERLGVYANSGCVCENAKQKGSRWVEIRKTARGCRASLKRL